MVYVKPKKSLGQHFLKDLNIAKKIVDSLSDCNHKVIEIGPGMGVLSKYLFERFSNNILLVDVDNESIEYLKQQFPNYNENIIYADFLKYNITEFDKLSIIGNFPYNISSQIFFKVLEHKDKVSEVVCMIQKEVAERIASKHGNKTYGILSVLLQTYFKIEYLFTVNETVFNPPPKVKSAVIRLTKKENVETDFDENLFFKIVKTTFNHRRKIISNTLKNINISLTEDNKFSKLRPEQLSYNEFIELTKLISFLKNN